MKKLMSRKAFVTLVLFVFAVTALALLENGRPKNTPALAEGPREVSIAVPARIEPVRQVPAPAPAQASPSSQTVVVASTAQPAAVDIPPLPANAPAVPDVYLLRLSALVNLAGAADQEPDKTRWAQAVPIAQALMAGPCDCDQRNWLKHFVKMGNDALSNSSADYAQEAQIISGLRRSDTQPVAFNK